MKIISVWGSPGGGKTTLAVEIAKLISERSINCLLLFTDDFIGPINYLFPSLENRGGSLGNILMNASSVQSDILKNLVSFSDNKYLSLAGYRKSESKSNYAEISEAQILDLFVSLGQIVDCVIVDCLSNFKDDPISKYALKEGQCVQVGGGDYKSITYFQNCHNFMRDYNGAMENNTIVVNNPLDFDCWMTVANQYGGDVEFAFPFCMEVQNNYLEEKSLSKLEGARKNREFLNELNLLVESLIGYDDSAKKNKKVRIKKEKKPKRQLLKKKSKGGDEIE